jgi:tetraacyldisaccharide 4'-kinase
VRDPVLINAAHDSSIDVGDEALMIAGAGVPVIAARDRAAGAALAISCGCDLIILDDGFQSPALAKDLSFVVVDSVYGIGNGAVIPAGPLRAPLPIQIAAAHALIIVSNGVAGKGAAAVVDLALRAGTPVFEATVEPDRTGTDFRGRRVVAFAGIGRPEKLAEGLVQCGALVEELIAFPDHHRYRPHEARALLARLNGTDRLLVTTAKDMARLTGDPDPSVSALAARALVAAVQLKFGREDEVASFLMRRLGELGALPHSAGNGTLSAPAQGLNA